MAYYYCSRSDLTDLLPTLVGSDISAAADQDSKLREPASRWIDSVYPGVAPFARVPDNDPFGWQVNQSDHEVGDTTVAIDTGSGAPAAGDLFQVQVKAQWNRDADRPWDVDYDDSRIYRVTAYSAPTLTFEPAAEVDFPDDAPIYFGPPSVVRQACRYFGLGLAYQIIRNNPEDELAASMFQNAKTLLHIPEDGFNAKARPGPTYNTWLSGTVQLGRAG